MDYAEYEKRFLETGSYETPASARSGGGWLSRRLFRLRMGLVYWHGFHQCRHPDEYVSRLWAPNGFEVVRAVERTGGTVRFEGFDNLARTKLPAVYVSNHVSALETYRFAPALRPFGTYTYILKESLAHYPLFSRVVKALRPVRVLRKNPVDDLRKVLSQGTEILREGRSVVVFPQGSRERLFDAATFNTLGVKLARHAGVPLVPLCVATDFLRIGEWQKDLFASIHPESTVRVACGPAIDPSLSQADMHRRSIVFVEETLRRWERTDGRPLLAEGSAAR